MSYRVYCEDGMVRHDGDFANKQDARWFAEWGHACTNSHTIKDTRDMGAQAPPWLIETLAAYNDVPLAAFHMALTDDHGYSDPGYVEAKRRQQEYDGLF